MNFPVQEKTQGFLFNRSMSSIEYEELPGWKEDLSKAKKLKDLPKNAQKYVERIEELTGCKVAFIGVGMKREQMIEK